MNAVEIEEAVSKLAEAPFDPAEFPYAFLEAFGNKATTIKKLRAGGKAGSNKSDFPGGVLQRGNIHLAVCPSGEVSETLKTLVASAATAKHKAKFALATDGRTIESQNLIDEAEPPLVCDYSDLGNHFGYFLALAGITTVRQIRENAFDIKATGRLNRLYVELLKTNPDWDAADRREDLNHFFARLIFCFFAEDTGIFNGDGLFTNTIQQMTEPDGSNTAWVLFELFRAMDTRQEKREAAKIRTWAITFPYVNGGLFAGSGKGEGEHPGVPAFSKIARSYLLHIGRLDWTKINPDIFGSMIQAVADDEERGALGMHYTSVPNILKVLNPLFLDDLRAKLDEAGDGSDQGSRRKLLNLRNRIARIRVFDPACGSGNFLVIAYKQMREIEAEINRRRGEGDRRSEIPLTNLRGIELRHFACEVARLALVIAEYQCDVLYRGAKLALAEFLPLDAENWITHGNALRLNWLSVCPPGGPGVRARGDDLFETPLNQPEMDFENEGGETYICGNPPYLGSRWRNEEQQAELAELFETRVKSYKDLDYVAAWCLKGADYVARTPQAECALVATKSICQGEQVAMLWPIIFRQRLVITFAHRPFHWSNLAASNAGVTVVIVGIGRPSNGARRIYEDDEKRFVNNIGPYLIPTENVIVVKSPKPINGLPRMDYGNKPTDGGNLILKREEKDALVHGTQAAAGYVRQYVGSTEFINGTPRFCLWIDESTANDAYQLPELAARFERVRELRSSSKGSQANANAATPHRFVFAPHRTGTALIVPRVSSERRPYLPAGLVDDATVVSDRAAVIYGPEPWVLALIVTRMHLVWIATVCVRMRMDFSYSNTLGWNTFPVPPLSEQNKADLTRRAEEILLAREAHWPATIADLYDPETMPADLREAHDRNDETLERIYIGRRFKNDTERLEKLFEMYTELTAKQAGDKPAKRKAKESDT